MSRRGSFDQQRLLVNFREIGGRAPVMPVLRVTKPVQGVSAGARCAL